jgi:hypothetical protein
VETVGRGVAASSLRQPPVRAIELARVVRCRDGSIVRRLLYKRVALCETLRGHLVIARKDGEWHVDLTSKETYA